MSTNDNVDVRADHGRLRTAGLIPRIVKERRFWHYGVQVDEYVVEERVHAMLLTWVRCPALEAEVDGKPNTVFESRWERASDAGSAGGEPAARADCRKQFDLYWQEEYNLYQPGDPMSPTPAA